MGNNDRGVSLYSLLHLNPEISIKRMLLKQIVNLPLWSFKRKDLDQLRPWNLYVRLRDTWIYYDDSDDDTTELKNPTGTDLLNLLELIYAPVLMNFDEDSEEFQYLGSTTEADNKKQQRNIAKAYYRIIQKELYSKPGEIAQGRLQIR